jgi:hypothetical protein
MRARMDAFISHSSHEAALAARIESRLQDKRITVWLDRSEIRLGQLLRTELQSAIRDSRVVVLVWSKAAAGSRWVAAEILTAFHLNRFVIACVTDKAALPYFLQTTIYLNLRARKGDWVDTLRRAIREAPAAANALPAAAGFETPELTATIAKLGAGQQAFSDRLDRNDTAGAKAWQARLDPTMKAALRKWPLEAMIQNLAGYHYKNAYQLKHWTALLAGRPPDDRLLERAERRFYASLFVNPRDYTALNGLGSILYHRRDLDAAEFFIRRALQLARKAGTPYPAAERDLRLVRSVKRGSSRSS